jgi:hypothetical protein
MSEDLPSGRPRAARPDMPAPDPEDLHDALALSNAPDPAPSRRRPTTGLERLLIATTAALIGAMAWPIGAAMTGAGADLEDIRAEGPPTADASHPVTDPAVPAPVVTRDAKIQIALLLDTSSSMNGLIDQARSQLWRVVGSLDSATFQGATPQLEIAVYEYGNDGLSAENGWIRQVVPFTSELDRVSEALFGLTTAGGSEHAGQVIERATGQLDWSQSDATLRVMYIAGNESFSQGPVDFRKAVAAAREQGVVINTVNCTGGSTQDDGWAEAASLGGGKFFSIDHNAQEIYVAAPQDDEIAKLGVAVNDTYIYFGARGAAAFENQTTQDNNALGSMGSSNVMRQLSKGSAYYRNDTWDLVDALEAGKVDLAKVEAENLPPEYRGLSTEELKTKVDAKRAERAEMKHRLAELKIEREKFISAERVRLSEDGPQRLDDAIIQALAEQAKAAGFTLDQA